MRPTLEPLETRAVPASLSGTAFCDTNGDAVRQPDEQPVAGALITLHGSDFTLQTLTDADGFWQFLDLPAGVYSVGQDAIPDLPDRVGEGVAVVGNGATFPGFANGPNWVEDIHLGPDDAATDYAFTEDCAPRAGLGQLDLFVFADLDADGVYEPDDGEHGLAGFTLDPYLVLADGVTGKFVGHGTTDDSGGAWLTDIPSGTYAVWWQQVPGWRLTTENGPRVVVPEGGVVLAAFGVAPVEG